MAAQRRALRALRRIPSRMRTSRRAESREPARRPHPGSSQMIQDAGRGAAGRRRRVSVNPDYNGKPQQRTTAPGSGLKRRHSAISSLP